MSVRDTVKGLIPEIEDVITEVVDSDEFNSEDHKAEVLYNLDDALSYVNYAVKAI